MNLYEIDNRITEAFHSALDPETGEIINEEAYEALDILNIEFDRKAEGILLWIKNLRAQAEALKNEKQAFAERQAAAERKAKSLEAYMSGVLDGRKFATERVSVSWRKSEAAEYSGDVKALPPDCIREKEPEVNKTVLKQILKQGAVIPGATLTVKNNIQIK